MSRSLHIAKVQVQWTDGGAWGYDCQEAMCTILFHIWECACGTINEEDINEYSEEYEVSKEDIKSVIQSITTKDAFYIENKNDIIEALKSCSLSIQGFVDILKRMVELSDPSNEWVRIAWF